MRRVVHALGLLIGGAAVGCGGGGGDGPTTPAPPATPLVRTVRVTPDSASLAVGSTRQLTAEVTADAGADRRVQWTSTAPTRASVDSTGLVTALTPGTALIVAIARGTPSLADTAIIAVTPVLASLTLRSETAELVPGQPIALTVEARDGSGAPMTSPQLTWTSADPARASVSSTGVVTAIGEGDVVITARAGAIEGRLTLRVVPGVWLTSAATVATLLGGDLRLEVPAGAVSTGTALRVRRLTATPAAVRLIPETRVTLEPAIALAGGAALWLRYPTGLAADVVETQLRVGRVDAGVWTDLPVDRVDRTARLVRARITASDTFAVFVPPVSLRGEAQRLGIDMGAATQATNLRNDSSFARLFAAEASTITPENEMKFEPIHPQPTTYAFANADSLLAFAERQGQRMHGHTLLWHSQQPAWLTAGTPTRASLLEALRQHIQTVVARYAGRITSWDVANEMIADDGSGLRSSFWTTIVGPDVIDSAFVWARRADPQALLFLNDYSVEMVNRKSDSLFALASRLRARGVPVDGVGLQAHLIIPSPSVSQWRANIDRFRTAGFRVRITELDVRLAASNTLDQQATAYRNAVSACLIAPRCDAITTWGLSDRYSWIPNAFPGFDRALPFDAQLAPKPAYAEMLAALRAITLR